MAVSFTGRLLACLPLSLPCLRRTWASLFFKITFWWRCLFSPVVESCLKTNEWLSRPLRSSQTGFLQPWLRGWVEAGRALYPHVYACNEGLPEGGRQVNSGWHRWWGGICATLGRLGTAPLGLRSCYLTLGTGGFAFSYGHILGGHQHEWGVTTFFSVCALFIFCSFIET